MGLTLNALFPNADRDSEKYLRKSNQMNEVEDALCRLDRSTQVASQMAAAQVPELTTMSSAEWKLSATKERVSAAK